MARCHLNNVNRKGQAVRQYEIMSLEYFKSRKDEHRSIEQNAHEMCVMRFIILIDRRWSERCWVWQNVNVSMSLCAMCMSSATHTQNNLFQNYVNTFYTHTHTIFILFYDYDDTTALFLIILSLKWNGIECDGMCMVHWDIFVEWVMRLSPLL